MTLAALVFDLDGTLVDTEELHRQAFNAAFIEAGLYWDWSPHLYARLLAVSGGAERLAHYVRALPVDAAGRARLLALVPGLHRAKTAIYRDLIAAGRMPLRPGMAQLIGEARAAGLRLALASTSSSENASLLLASVAGGHAKLPFETVVSADMVAAPKPSSELYGRVLATLRLDAAECVALEDSANGVRAATGAGIVTVAVPTRWTIEQDLSAADLLVPALDELDAPLETLRAAHRRGRLRGA